MFGVIGKMRKEKVEGEQGWRWIEGNVCWNGVAGCTIMYRGYEGRDDRMRDRLRLLLVTLIIVLGQRELQGDAETVHTESWRIGADLPSPGSSWTPFVYNTNWRADRHQVGVYSFRTVDAMTSLLPIPVGVTWLGYVNEDGRTAALPEEPAYEGAPPHPS